MSFMGKFCFIVILLATLFCLEGNAQKKRLSAYHQAYEKAKAQAEAERLATAQKNGTTSNSIPVRTEKVVYIEGAQLQKYGVVAGSFTLKQNAQGLKAMLVSKGYNASIVLNESPSLSMYRVIAYTSNSLEDVDNHLRDVNKDYPNSWLLAAEGISNPNYGSNKTNYAQTNTSNSSSINTSTNNTVQYSTQVSNQVSGQISAQSTVSSVSKTSLIDVNIPTTSNKNTNVFAVVIGNEKYENEVEVPFAENDAKIFREYANKTLGVPEKQIRYVPNGTLNGIRMAVRWLSQAMDICDGHGQAIFYYAGHGIPDEANKTAFLLPVDGVGNDPESAYSLDKLYKELGKMPAQRVTVFLDACFSGAKREGGMLASARGVAIKVKQTAPQGKMIVFTAAQGDETAYPYKDEQHGLFTYFLLKKLKESKGDITLGELGDYLTMEVKRQSFVENGKQQTPSVLPSMTFTDTWRKTMLK